MDPAWAVGIIGQERLSQARAPAMLCPLPQASAQDGGSSALPEASAGGSPVVVPAGGPGRFGCSSSGRRSERECSGLQQMGARGRALRRRGRAMWLMCHPWVPVRDIPPEGEGAMEPVQMLLPYGIFVDLGTDFPTISTAAKHHLPANPIATSV